MAVIAPSRIAERVAAGPVRPTREELAPLGWFERLAFWWCDLVNSRRWPKRLSQVFAFRIGAAWVHLCTRRLVRLDGAAVLRELDPAAPVLVCANHRSFFDMYLITSYFAKTTGRLPNIFFPVRANFFYEGPLGLFVNMVMAAFAMYPPIFRQESKKGMNFYSLARAVELARTPNALLGFHPEGTRGKGPDPYALLPAQPGVGQIIYEARPTVLPVFVNGLGNDLPRQILGNFTGKGAPVWVVFGKPLDLSIFYERGNRLRTHKEIADHVVAEIVRLGERERALRAGQQPDEPTQAQAVCDSARLKQ